MYFVSKPETLLYSTVIPPKRRGYKRYIEISFDYVGFHKYADAPEQVAFLRNNHRHKFEVNATIEVFHNDRDLEFFMVLDDIGREVLPHVLTASELGSCEMQAERLIEGILNLYGDHRYASVTVTEDGENGGTIEWHPPEVHEEG